MASLRNSAGICENSYYDSVSFVAAVFNWLSVIFARIINKRAKVIHVKSIQFCINLLKPAGYVMHHQFNVQQLYVLPTHCIYVFCIYLRTNSELCHL